MSRFLCSFELGFGSFAESRMCHASTPLVGNIAGSSASRLSLRLAAWFQLFYDSLAQVGQVIVLGKPAVLDIFETNAPSDGPVASSFASFGRSQDIDLKFSWCAQEYPRLSVFRRAVIAIKSCKNYRLGRSTVQVRKRRV
jgi:hypothetical protein